MEYRIDENGRMVITAVRFDDMSEDEIRAAVDEKWMAIPESVRADIEKRWSDYQKEIEATEMTVVDAVSRYIADIGYDAGSDNNLRISDFETILFD